MKRIVTTSAIILLTAAVSQSSFSELIRNGSFENSVAPDSQTYHTSVEGGNTSDIPWWEVTYDSVDVVGRSLWPASDGERSIDLNGLSPGGIKQSFATQSGRNYQVTFDIFRNAKTGQEPKEIEVKVAGLTIQFAYDLSIGDQNQWQDRGFIFTAIEDVTTLEFISLIGSPAGPPLDNVSVRAVGDDPTPSATPTERLATGTAEVVNGFVVSVNVTDSGFGYIDTPSVRLVGGGGTGAAATASLLDNTVAAITITSPGSGYTSAPTVEIDPPPFPPQRAAASVEVVNGFVVGVTVTDGGFGYDEVPTLLILDDVGTGATATATIADSVVTGVTITDPGTGYSDATRVLIASPPFAPALDIFVTRVGVNMRVLLGRTYRLESSKDFVTWTATGSDFIATDELFTQEFDVEETGTFFRLVEVQ